MKRQSFRHNARISARFSSARLHERFSLGSGSTPQRIFPDQTGLGCLDASVLDVCDITMVEVIGLCSNPCRSGAGVDWS